MSNTSRSGCRPSLSRAGREATKAASMTCILRACNPRAIRRRSEILASIRRMIGFFSDDMLAPLCSLIDVFLTPEYTCHTLQILCFVRCVPYRDLNVLIARFTTLLAYTRHRVWSKYT